jgi:hypothetical protein
MYGMKASRVLSKIDADVVHIHCSVRFYLDMIRIYTCMHPVSLYQ